MPGRCSTPSIICSATRPATSSKPFAASAARNLIRAGPRTGFPVDFSTGSVGLGVAVTAFASLVQDYLLAHGMMQPEEAGRMVALMGDAELDEGNIYECLIEGYKHDIRNCWWIVDYNRQSLDATTADRMFGRFDEIFATCGWRVATLKYGKALEAAFAEPGGETLRDWIDRCPNADYAALTYLGGGAWRERLLKDGAGDEAEFSPQGTTTKLAALMTNLAGHAWPRWSRRSTARRTTSRPCSSPTRSRASACPSPATRTIMPA